MTRRPRIDLPHVTQHIIQHGNDRQSCFFTAADYKRYRCDLREIAFREGCEIHAYVLMTNHVHLLMTPCEAGQIARIMQAPGAVTSATSMIVIIVPKRSGRVATKHASSGPTDTCCAATDISNSTPFGQRL